MDDHISELSGRLKDLVVEMRALDTDKNWLLQHYWIDQSTFPQQATATQLIAKEIAALNATHIHESEVSRRVISIMIRAVWEPHFDEETLLDDLRNTVAFLVNYSDSHQIDVQLENIWARGEFSLGSVSIVPIPNQGDLTEYNLKYDTHSLGSGDPSSVNAYSRVSQAAGLGTAASQNAISETERVLKILRGVGLPTLWGRRWGQMGVRGRTVGTGWSILRTSPGYWNSGLRSNFDIKTWFVDVEDLLSNYSQADLAKLTHLYADDHRSKLENKVLQALFWLGEATFPVETASKFAYLSIAFECAIGGDANDESLKEIGITQMLAERTAFLLGDSLATRRAWHSAVVKLYGTRSRVMHGDSNPVSEFELSRWAYLVWTAVRAMLRLTGQLTNVEQVADWIRNQRYALP